MDKESSYLNSTLIKQIIHNALEEDIGSGDYSTLASISENAIGHASIIVKDNGILAGVAVAEMVFMEVDPELSVSIRKLDADRVVVGDVVLELEGNARSILSAERLVLNILQRMSGIATKTNKLSLLIEDSHARLLDTRKTTPNFRIFEKLAVKIGGGRNHRFALYDMIMLKDNHIDYAGGITKAVSKVKKYLAEEKLDLKIEVETRNIEEVKEALQANIDIIMLDNMTLDQLGEAVQLVDKTCITEASGGIDELNIKDVAATGVDYISVGALTHSYKSLDMSLMAQIKI